MRSDKVAGPRQGSAPFLRWAGGKRQLLPVLARYWNEKYKRYIEPFAGSACLFFHLAPAKAILGDLNTELIGTLRELKMNPQGISARLRQLRKGREHYLTMRAIAPASIPAPERAARFIYLNRFCFNGLYRTNGTGRFNVPYGGEKSGSLPATERLLACSLLLKNATLIAGDFEKVLERVKPGDFVYMDPPFSVKARRVFNEYDKSLFSFDDVVRLRGWMEGLAVRNISFLVSYAESDEADFLKGDFHTEVVAVRRNIAGFSDKRKHSRELLISFIAGKKRSKGAV
ncbi:MAG: Dam family site-specific DNA-(adenine-N6)-methyltransferase [Acidobacteria bacterium]|nr:Dam family site-specific DNA-(adenine-N6)-methyltransferase [Acidobacteriota bacterium]